MFLGFTPRCGYMALHGFPRMSQCEVFGQKAGDVWDIVCSELRLDTSSVNVLFVVIVDDRFILKQMARLEVHSFVEFAPHYFQYITKACNESVSISPRLVMKV